MPEYPRKFIHKGEDHMSYKGVMVSANTYWFHNKNNKSNDEIFLKFGTPYDVLFKARAKAIQRFHETFPRIRNMQEHYEYILKNFIGFEDAVKLREKMKGKTDEEIIHMMPPAFGWVLAHHLLQQKRQGRGSVKPKAVEPEPEDKSMDYLEVEGDGLNLL